MVPLTNEYWDYVVSHSVAEIRAGRTPNPDMLCNSRVKFGAFYDYLDKNHEGCFDRIASGHYARVVRLPKGDDSQDEEAVLCMTPDVIKDQTYFLAHLNQSQLSRTMFPLGSFTKSQVRQLSQVASHMANKPNTDSIPVRRLAEVADLANKGRKDSQGICFLGKVKFSEFVKEHLGEWPGPIIDIDSGSSLAEGGAVGQSPPSGETGSGLSPPVSTAGFGAGNMVNNIVYVSRSYYDSGRRRDAFSVGPISWLSSKRPDHSQGAVQVKVRHGPQIYNCRLLHMFSSTAEREAFVATGFPDGTADLDSFCTDGQYGAYIVLDGDDQGLAAGQYAVLYQDG
eukprot:gene29583-5936_t